MEPGTFKKLKILKSEKSIYFPCFIMFIIASLFGVISTKETFSESCSAGLYEHFDTKADFFHAE